MGLDMYLEKFPRFGNATIYDVQGIEQYLEWKGTEKEKHFTLEEWCGYNESKITKDRLDFYTPKYVEKFYAWDDEHRHGHKGIIDDIGYWRKANAIHRWFVENIQDGTDDCEYYEVTKENLIGLRNLCNSAIQKANFDEQNIKIINSKEMEEILPTQCGFFFGDTAYDDYYYDSLVETVEIIDKVLENTDFDKEVVVYGSSW